VIAIPEQAGDLDGLLMVAGAHQQTRIANSVVGLARWAVPQTIEWLEHMRLCTIQEHLTETAATPIAVSPGADFRGVDFSLLRVTPRTIRGVVINSTTGQPARLASVVLVPSGRPVTGSLLGRPSSEGSFEIKGVIPGSYSLVASARTNTPSSGVRIKSGRVPRRWTSSTLGPLQERLHG
jgi:hypothetical protein